MLERRIPVEGLELEVLESHGAGPHVFMLHGNSSSAETFRALFESPLGERFKLVALSLPGHGRSTASVAPREQYSITNLARISEATITQYGAQEYALVGHSIGGHVFSHALPGLSTARGLILVSAPPISLSVLSQAFKPDPAGGAIFRGELDVKEIEVLARALLGPAGADAALLDGLRRSIKRTDRAFRPALGESIVAGELDDEVANVAHTQVPVAMVWGTDDAFINPGYYESIQAGQWLNGGRFPFHGSGHSPHLDRPREFAALLSKLLTEIFEPSRHAI